MVQDLLRGPSLAAVSFFDRGAVVRFLDGVPRLDPARRAHADPILLMLASACVLQERYGL